MANALASDECWIKVSYLIRESKLPAAACQVRTLLNTEEFVGPLSWYFSLFLQQFPEPFCNYKREKSISEGSRVIVASTVDTVEFFQMYAFSVPFCIWLDIDRFVFRNGTLLAVWVAPDKIRVSLHLMCPFRIISLTTEISCATRRLCISCGPICISLCFCVW